MLQISVKIGLVLTVSHYCKNIQITPVWCQAITLTKEDRVQPYMLERVKIVILHIFFQVAFLCILAFGFLGYAQAIGIRANPDGTYRLGAMTEASHHHNSHSHRRYTETASFIHIPGLNPAFVSPRVIFSRHIPTTDPWSNQRTEADNEQSSVNEGSEEDGRRGLTARQRRSEPAAILPCQLQNRLAQRSTARNENQQTVRVVEQINVAGVTMFQSFHETECASPNKSCIGIDTERFTSKCKTHHTLAYARVIDTDGVEGWHLVEIPSGCNCLLYQKSETITFLDVVNEEMSQGR